MSACATVTYMPVLSYAKHEWLEKRPIIEHLYLEKNLSMDQVRDRLHKADFHVNTRMLKTRLLKWGFHKKLHTSDLHTALRILGSDRSQWPSPEPSFRIRGRVVGIHEILRSCGRKGIRDPFTWVHTTACENAEDPSNVELLVRSVQANDEKEFHGPHQPFSFATHTACSSPSVHSPLVIPANHFEANHRNYAQLLNSLDWPLRDPDVYIYAATAVHQVRSYCMGYMTSTLSLSHREPQVHHLTCHARFLDRMDEGIFLFSQGKTKVAFDKFGRGFELLTYMFKDLHPMAVATYLLLLCKLATNNVTSVSCVLLSHAHKLAGMLRAVPQCLVDLLYAISQCQHLLDVSLLCLHVATDALEANSTTHWKTLYVKERHCDALYCAQRYTEVAKRRVQLLHQQETNYGPSARNVLWTSLNVADDHVTHDQLHEAEARFVQVAQQSDQHSGYHRAKSRFAALEGLGKVALKKASKQVAVQPNELERLRSRDASSQFLQQALQFVDEALELGRAWFENESRRVERLLKLRNQILASPYLESGDNVT